MERRWLSNKTNLRVLNALVPAGFRRSGLLYCTASRGPVLSPAGQDRADDGMTEQLMGAVDREDPDRRGAVEPVVPEHRKSRCEGDEEAPFVGAAFIG